MSGYVPDGAGRINSCLCLKEAIIPLASQRRWGKHLERCALPVKAHRFIVLGLLLMGLVHSVWTAVEPVPLATITNPVPAAGTGFGSAVALVGTDRLVVGNPNVGWNDLMGVGAAYLFNTNGELVTTFTNPTPAAYENFGSSIAVMGTDRILIGTPGDGTGAPYAGAVYLFSSDGTLISTMTNPVPASSDNFGYAVAALGTDRVIVTAPNKSIGSAKDGAAYILDTSGMLLTTITNPIPGPYPYDHFGSSVAVVGESVVAIGAHLDEPDELIEDAGVVHLFSTNGLPMNTITNPFAARGDNFGWSVAAVGQNQLLVGAFKDDRAAQDSGTAYLYDSNFSLSLVITNPTPEVSDQFGYALAGAGPQRMLVSAPNDRAGTNLFIGVIHVFNLDGTLEDTLINPTPAHNDQFGRTLAGSSSLILTGAPQDDTAGSNAGAAYLFRISEDSSREPVLHIVLTNGNAVGISWMPDTPGFTLQEADNLASNTWFDAASGTTNPVVIPAVHTSVIYRLRGL